MNPTDDPRATRREHVRQLHATGASTRAIAAKLGVHKDTVRRDLAHLAQTPNQHKAPAEPTLRQQIAARNEQAFTAMRQLAAAVAQVEAERVSHLVVTEPVAHRLEDEVRHHATALLRLADAFNEYYPRPESLRDTQQP